METVKNKLSNVLLGDAPVVAEPKVIPTMPTVVKQENKIYAEKVNEPAANLPEPPVVVYVKEVAKAGI